MKRKPTELKRGAPPPAVLERNQGGRPRGPIYRNLEQLAETPGEWGQITVRSTKAAAQQAVYHLRRGGERTPPGNWEIVWGRVDEDNPRSDWGVWARLINDKEGDSATPNAGGEHRSR